MFGLRSSGVWAVALLLAGMGGSLAQEGNLLHNPGFEDVGDEIPGWMSWPSPGIRASLQPGVGRQGSAACLVASTLAEYECGGLSQQIPVEANSRLRIHGWLRTEGFDAKGGAVICVQIHDGEGNFVGFGTTAPKDLSRATEWTEVSATFGAPPGATRATVMPGCSGKGKAWFDDLELTREGAATEEDLKQAAGFSLMMSSGIRLARGAWQLRAAQATTAFTVSLPIPMCYLDQSPLGYRVQADPAAKLLGYALRERLPEDWVADLKIAALAAGEGVTISWEAPVLVRWPPQSPVREQIPFPDPAMCPDAVKPWLAPTRCVQAGDPRIVAQAKKLREDGPDLLAFARRVALACCEAMTGPTPTRHDALSGLEGVEGICAGNLAAALFRAGGVPARTVMALPSQPVRLPLLGVEFWAGERGWLMMSPGNVQVPLPRTYVVLTALVYPADEEASFRDDPARPCATWSPAGVPWMTLVEGDARPGLTAAGALPPAAEAPSTDCRIWVRFKQDDLGADVALKDAQAFWKAYRAVLAQGRTLPAVEDRIEEMKRVETAGQLDILLEQATRLLTGQ